MTMAYVRNTYRVPVRRGARVTVETGDEGVVTSATCRVAVRLDGEKTSRSFHPMDLIYHLPAVPLPTQGRAMPAKEPPPLNLKERTLVDAGQRQSAVILYMRRTYAYPGDAWDAIESYGGGKGLHD